MFAVLAEISGGPRGAVGTLDLLDALGMAKELAGEGIASGGPWSVVVTDRRTGETVARIGIE